MTPRRGALLGLRLLFNVFFLATSLYCLLAYVPFSYQQFIRDGLVSGLVRFASFHSYLYWLAFGAGAASVASDARSGRARLLARAFIGTGTLAGIALWVHPVLARAHSDTSSLVACLAALVPVLWVAVIDHVGHGAHVVWSSECSGNDRRGLLAALRTAPFLMVLYATIAYARMWREGAAVPGPPTWLLVLSWSLALHFAVFMAAFVALDLIRHLARGFGRTTRGEFWLAGGLLALVGATAFLKIVLEPLTFAGADGLALAAAYSLTATAVLSGLAVRLHPEDGPAVESGAALLLGPLAPPRDSSVWAPALWLTLLGAAALWVALATAPMDWNYLLQKVSVLLVWLLAFAAFYAVAERGSATRRPLPALLLATALVPVAGYRALDRSQALWPGLAGDAPLQAASALSRHTGYDVSLRILYDVVSAPSSATDASLYAYLQRNTNIPQDVSIQPVSVDQVESLTATSGPKPDVYVIVVDSLRRDYLSPYNPRVTFTPSIARFAAESQVFTNAFTHYGATGLSQPSIWVGGMLVHKQYVTPFAPMNTLVKLLEAERYQNFISRDSILRSIVPPSFEATDLDAGVPNKDYDLCRSLGVLESQLDARRGASRPVFAYTQPQNLHVSRITREGASVPPSETYPGFYAPYAARVRHIDTCVGQFIQYLKDRGRFDRSVVILTSDHGDSLGESGRWGHAYTLFPEIVRIPLIMHLPAAAQATASGSSPALAFSTDITPTLYALLGHPPTSSSPVLGRSLLDRTMTSGEDWQLLASSYGPVYGTLHGNGRWLYIVDAVNYQDYYYDLETDPSGEHNLVTAEIRREQQARVREGVHRINLTYQVPASFER